MANDLVFRMMLAGIKITAQLCLNCYGQKTVSKPPWIAGDQKFWDASTTALCQCPTCEGAGIIHLRLN